MASVAVKGPSVMLPPCPLCSVAGATTVTSTSGISSNACTTMSMPSADTPSSLVTSTRTGSDRCDRRRCHRRHRHGISGALRSGRTRGCHRFAGRRRCARRRRAGCAIRLVVAATPGEERQRQGEGGRSQCRRSGSHLQRNVTSSSATGSERTDCSREVRPSVIGRSPESLATVDAVLVALAGVRADRFQMLAAG